MSAVKEDPGKTEGLNEQPVGHALSAKGAEPQTPARREPSRPTLWTESPLVFMRRFTEDMERFFDDFGSFRLGPLFRRDLRPRLAEFGRGVWSPEVEVFKRDGNLVVRADLPGLAKEDVTVELADEALTLSGERREEKEEKGEGFYRTERTYGAFFRRIPLPEGVETEGATATFRNGVLEVVMAAPQREPKGRTLEIKEESAKPAGAKAAAG